MKALGSVDPNTRKESGKEEVVEKRRREEGRREKGKKGRRDGEKGWFPFIHWTSVLL